MTRRGLLLTAILGLVSIPAPAFVAADEYAARVSGAGQATLPEGVSFHGVQLSGLQLGQGVLINPDGSAAGHFHVVLSGTGVIGQAQEIIVQGDVNAGDIGGEATATFSGTALLTIGEGSVPIVGVPFTVIASTGSLQLTLDGATLPSATLTEGSITIK